MANVAIVTVRPVCDIHKYEQNVLDEPAFYDARTVMGPWANLCHACFLSHTSGQLGTGYGQRLVVKGEK